MTYLDQLVVQQLDTWSEAVAIVDAGVRWTYAQVGRRAAAIAAALTASGVRSGDNVCLVADKSAEAIAAMLAIMAVGGVYVPLEPTSPARRLVGMIRSLEPALVIAQRGASVVAECARMLGASARRILELDAVSHDARGGDLAALRHGPRSDDALAVILFTSGSTGEPKGVPLTHAGISHFVLWSNAYFAPLPGDRLTCHSPLTFDAALWDIFRALSSGAELHLVPASANLLPTRLAAFIRESRITQWDSVPSVLTAMAGRDVVAPGDFPDLRKLIWYGEVFPVRALRYWMTRLPHVEFINTYGPTETSVTASTYRIPAVPASDSEAIPIGRAVDGKQLIVLDGHRQPVAAGEIGELYIGGVGVSPGYWPATHPANSAFVELVPGSGQRWYRTGDRASIGAEGLVWFHGRADRQIKSRGCRIELDEIECVLGGLPGLVESSVVAVASDAFGGVRICAAYVPAPGNERDPAALRTELAGFLPSYMLPTRWLRLESLPKNRNGKVDHPALEQRFLIDEAPQRV